MTIADSDRRQFTRCFFSREENVEAALLVTDQELKLSALLMDVSAGGICVALPKGHDVSITKGEIHTLEAISGLPQLDLIRNVPCEIKWIVNVEALGHTGVGYEFKDIPGAQRDYIQGFVLERIQNHQG